MAILSQCADVSNYYHDLPYAGPLLTAVEQLRDVTACRSAFLPVIFLTSQKIQKDCSEIVVALPSRQYNVRGLLIN